MKPALPLPRLALCCPRIVRSASNPPHRLSHRELNQLVMRVSPLGNGHVSEEDFHHLVCVAPRDVGNLLKIVKRDALPGLIEAYRQAVACVSQARAILRGSRERGEKDWDSCKIEKTLRHTYSLLSLKVCVPACCALCLVSGLLSNSGLEVGDCGKGGGA